MHEVLRTNDLVFLSFIEAALRAEGLAPVVLDHQAATMDGGVIAVQRRLMVPASQRVQAEAALKALEQDYGPF